MRILVTGAGGFVASHLIPTLAEEGHEVFGLAQEAARVPVAAGVTPVEADLRRPLDVALPRLDAIVHLAQANVSFPTGARDLVLVNVAGTQQLLDQAREQKARFVYASSGSVYGLGEGAVAEDDPRRATDFYAVTKRSAELAVEAYRSYVEATILRLFTPYGPGQRDRMVSKLIERVRNGTPVVLNDGGRPRATPIFVEDVVRIVRAALGGEAHAVVNVAGDEVVSVRELAELIGEALGREPVFEDGSSEAEGDLVGSNKLMHRLYEPGPLVPLREGLRRTVGVEVLA
jgi:nucleoside-diphosphate-sugar epimerase